MMRACLVLIASLSALAPRLADACSPAVCVGGTITPGYNGAVPANLPGLVWRPLFQQALPDNQPDPSKLTLTRTDTNTTIGFTTRTLAYQQVLIVPDAPLVAGATYEVNDATTCYGSPSAIAHSPFTVRAETPMPTALGTITASDSQLGPLYVATWSGSCTSEVDASQRSIRLRLAPGTDAWLELLDIKALVDDHPWWGGPVTKGPAGASVDVYRTCAAKDSGADGGLGAGPHTLRFEATLPGTALVLASNSVTFELSCEDTIVDDTAGDGGCSASRTGSLSGLVLALGALIARRRR